MTRPDGALDLSDIDCAPPPAGWAPAVVDADPLPADVPDKGQEPDA